MLICILLPALPPLCQMCSPAWFEPTKDKALISGASHRKLTQSCVPCTMFRVPAGNPASSASSASLTMVPGTRSEGLRTKVLPVAMARGNIQRGIMAGKLKGAMPPHTPRGCLYEYVSSPPPTFSTVSPIMCDAAPHAYSTTSSPLNTSPLASMSVLPCSSVMILARTSMFSLIRCWYRNMTLCFSDGVTSRQVKNAFDAASTALCSSSGVAKGTLHTTSCVAGFVTVKNSVALESWNLPLM
mmetsp:Transcript_12651/g.25028  ORF Transcript_12651/g.25028 Transcript_12651/m.25028 type:complete len:242 (-) Transcript_12651:288-1013(-)